MTTDTAVPVLWLDLDGTVRESVDDPLGRFVNGPDDVRVFPEAVTMMRRWRAKGGRIVGVSNQGGIALGHVTYQQVSAAIEETKRQCDDLFDLVVYCPHHPDADREYKARCGCRKPKAGLIASAMVLLTQEHPGEAYYPHLGLMVGDMDSDRVCAEAADLDYLDAREWRAQAHEEVAP